MPSKPLLPLSDALAQLLEGVEPRGNTERVPLGEALGRVLATDQCAYLDVPPADNSAMDGYALRAADAGLTLPITQRITAGDVANPLAPGGVARIFTGAEIPPGADAVAVQEEVTHVGDRVKLPATVVPGQHIRLRAQDCARGDLLLPRGRRIRPQDLGLLASQGASQVSVMSRVRVALLSTGNELREAGPEPLPQGAIYNSNRPMLSGLLSAMGCEVLDMGIVPDTAEATLQTMRSAAESADVILSSGGVSVGEADHVRDVVSALGEIALWRVAIKPGKPFAFGRVGDVPFLGLPGNPSSAFVTFLLLARPYLCALQGREKEKSRAWPARADFVVATAGSREEFLRVTTRIEGDSVWAKPYENQSSGVLRSVSACDALAVIPRGQTVEPGQVVQVLSLDELLD